MITSVHTVLIGKKCPDTYTTADKLEEGDVALFDKNKAIIKTATDAVNAASLYVGVAGPKMSVTMPNGEIVQKVNIEFSTEIQKASKPSVEVGKYVAPSQEEVTVTLNNATIVAGNRYVLRIYYKDLYEDKSQFTHTYEQYATSATAKDLASAFAEQINSHKGRRVQATVDDKDTILTLTALPKDDNEGVDSINEYSIVSMKVSLYQTIPGALLANQPAAVPGAVISKKTVGNPGKGYWKQVRDAEARNMGYKGHVFTGAYPIVEQARKVVKDKTYDYAIIENDNLYLSNDNQYIKTTPLTTELYVEANSLKDSIVDKGLQSFITGKVVA